ncbi:MAG TPA: class I SAM-dependent methyltransferase [Limnochordales bacterium]
MSTAYWLLSIAGGVIALSIVLPAFVGGAWSPTSMARVRAMLRMANLAPGETLYDLGAGDGRVILTAAREFGARAVGIEIDPLRAALCTWRIRLARLQDRVRVERANFFDVDLRKADVVTFYLSQAAADRLKEKFEAELRPGARVVSHRRPVPGWRPAAVDERRGLYVYVIGKTHAADT